MPDSRKGCAILKCRGSGHAGMRVHGCVATGTTWNHVLKVNKQKKSVGLLRYRGSVRVDGEENAKDGYLTAKS